MGLNIWMYRISKPEKLPDIITSEWMQENGYWDFPVKSNPEDLIKDLNKEIIPYSLRHDTHHTMITKENIKKEYGFEDFGFGGPSEIDGKMQYTLTDFHKTIYITEEEYREKCLKDVVEDSYVCKKETLYNWYDEFSLSEYLSKIGGKLYDDSYYILTRDQVVDIVNYCLEHQDETEMSTWSAETEEFYPKKIENVLYIAELFDIY